MALSEHEQQVIAELERALLRDDPALAAAFGTKGTGGAGKFLVVGLGVLGGLGLLVYGAISELVLVGVAGFALMFAALTWAVTRKPSGSFAAAADGDQASANKGISNAANFESGGFMNRIEDRWNRRQGDPTTN